MKTEPALLIADQLNLAYGRGGGTAQVVHDFSLTLESGEAVGVVGESGAGKSTVGHEILGLLGRRGGVRSSGSLGMKIKPEQIALIPQDPCSALDPLFSIGNQLRELGASREAIAAALDEVHLPLEKISLKSYPHELSGGMLQRLVIAMALLRRPALVIADEPTSSLDVTLQAEVIRLFREIHGRGTAFLFITHHLLLAAQFCDRLLVMREGRVLEEGSPEQILEHPRQEYTRRLVRAIPVLT